jgi:hypothetical protein
MQGANKSSGSSPLGSPSIVRRVDAALGLMVSGFGSLLYKCGVPVPSEVAFAERMSRAEREIAESRKALEAYDAEKAAQRTSMVWSGADVKPSAETTARLG